MALLKNNNSGETIELVHSRYSIGRSEDNSIRFQDTSLSRYHAELQRTPNGWQIQDLGSTHGTHVNNTRIKNSASIKDGDKIQLGKISLTFFDADLGALVTQEIVIPEGDSLLDPQMAQRIQNRSYFAGYAGFWKRFGAAFIDAIIVFILAFIAAFVFGIYHILTEGTEEGIEGMAYLAAIIAYWLYFASMESSPKQATFGKMALGIQVTDMSGHRISFGRATGRFFAKFISSFILYIGYLMAAFTSRKQALHDMIASCLVVNKT